jgi:acetyltransferase-like isoleucine patch superfamily enzyme
VRVARGVRLSVARDARVILEDGCSLGERCRIEANGGTVRIGAGARIGERAILVAAAGIDVGTGVDVGDWAIIADSEPTWAETAVPVRIGDGARIGLHAAILAGAEIAPGEVVAPYATRAGGRRERGDLGPAQRTDLGPAAGRGDQETRAPRSSP